MLNCSFYSLINYGIASPQSATSKFALYSYSGKNTPFSFSTKTRYLKVLAKLLSILSLASTRQFALSPTHPHLTIPTFSPQEPHLIQTIINWLQRTVLET